MGASMRRRSRWFASSSDTVARCRDASRGPSATYSRADNMLPVAYIGRMRFCLIILTVAMANFLPTKAEAQLLSQSTEGLRRICTYRAGPTGSEVRTHAVGIGDMCPAFMPPVDESLPAPQTARYESEIVDAGQRVCTYVQGVRHWNVDLPLNRTCPLSAGQALQYRAEQRTPINR